ncbi:uncharacterized protein LOC136074711 [Hydra vulgaris]|uniref:Uncharacterized protein LOC136074711 n=1 Tax=Hydra vulgaris TaxID=6087 RepID=A0ABM4B2S7_HYDVU
MTTSAVFDFTEMPSRDNGIGRYEEHEYEPINDTNLNSPGDIRIDIEQQELFTLPSKAYLLFEGQLVKADGTAYANADAVALTNNGLMHLFSRITYQLSNQEIEAVYYPSQATTMLGMLNYANDFQLTQGLHQLWYKDYGSTAVFNNNQGFGIRQAYIIQKPTIKGTFSFWVPVRHIFGFCDDYDKVIYELKHAITLVRQSDDNAIFRLAAAAAGKVNLNKVSLFLPNLITADTEIKKSTEIPRYIIVGLQTNKANSDQTVNASIFDHCDLKNMYIFPDNNDRYLAVDYNLSFPNQQT